MYAFLTQLLLKFAFETNSQYCCYLFIFLLIEVADGITVLLHRLLLKSSCHNPHPPAATRSLLIRLRRPEVLTTFAIFCNSQYKCLCGSTAAV